MKTRPQNPIVLILFVFLFTVSAGAQTTAFKYQGSLTDGGNPANGSFQMQFKLFDSLAGPTQIGSTLNDVPVTATGGTFSVSLDFGASAFGGANRWIEIAVRHNSGEGYVTLSPREQIASSPYAVRTLSAATADDSQKLGGVNASEYATTSSNAFIKNSAAQQPGANFNIQGNGQLGGNLSAIGRLAIGQNTASFPVDILAPTTDPTVLRVRSTVGASLIDIDSSLAEAGLRFRKAGVASWEIYNASFGDLVFVGTGGNRMLIQNSTGNVGVGTSTPTRLLHVNGRARVGSIPLEESAAHVCFNSAGDLLQCGASSLKLKDNIHPFALGLETISRLRPINFNWKESGITDIGLGAEEVATVAPVLALRDADGNVAGVKYEKLNLVLINAVKEQQKQIEALCAELKDQRIIISRLQTRRHRSIRSRR